MKRERQTWGLSSVARCALFVCCALLTCACDASDGATSLTGASSSEAQVRFDLTELRAHEAKARAGLKLESLQGADVTSGSDPYQLLALAAAPGMVAGLLRGSDQLVVFDAAGKELARGATPHAPSAIAEGPGALWVVSELSREIWSYPLSQGGGLGTPNHHHLTMPAALRGLVNAAGHWYASDELAGVLVRLNFSGENVEAEPIVGCKGALGVRATPHWLGVDCVLEHRIKLFRLPESGPLTKGAASQEIGSDGPFWAFALWESEQALEVVASGVEDAPLDRTIGSFGNIDSFLYSFRVDSDGVRQTSAVNVSELGVVLPKALWVETGRGDDRRVSFAGYATSGLVELSWTRAGLTRPRKALREVPPGTRDLVHLGEAWMIANPLLDAWVEVRDAGNVRYREEASPGHVRSPAVRLGEALFFTTLMAPKNESRGKLSRFTCETCHFEGYGDGRVHATGRGKITATTKPLLGLVGNRPYFTRALDRDLAQMVNNEFRVAGANSGSSPTFDAHLSEWPWLRQLGVRQVELSAEALREALLDFLVQFNHRPNPYLAERQADEGLTETEARGASLFAEHCASCHAPRLEAARPGTAVPVSDWPMALRRNMPLVWASAGYQDTGVEPRVHPLGGRPSSLRRLYKKAPYFTNGGAPDLAGVLTQSGYVDGRFIHQGLPASGTRFTKVERLALEHFLRLL